MNDNQRGLYSKYHVTKDGKPLDGDCFVLRPDRDPAAVAALRAYAAATENNALARDIIGWVGTPEPLTLKWLKTPKSPTPVWIELFDEPLDSGWDMNDPHLSHPATCMFWANDYYAVPEEDYGKTWLAYASNPNREVLS